MGVKNLWALFESCSREVPIDSLSGKRLAVDASIWMYQFIKAMRSSDGNPLKGAHILGFYQRICKLLYFGIKPVFVFDGTPPALKRATLAKRRSLKIDAGESVKRTATKLLETRIKLSALDSFDKDTSKSTETASLISNVRKTDDQYAIHSAMKELMFPEDDERLATEEELRAFISDHIDTNPLDMDSTLFSSLPTTLQHELILAKKHQSRHPSTFLSEPKSSLDFSKQQITNLVNRNKMSERLYDFTKSAGVVKNGVGKSEFSGRVEVNRVASQRDRQYILVKRDEEDQGGWKMMINMDMPVKIEAPVKTAERDDACARVIQNTLDETFASDQDEDIDCLPQKTSGMSHSPVIRDQSGEVSIATSTISITDNESSDAEEIQRAIELSLQHVKEDVISSESEEFEEVEVPVHYSAVVKSLYGNLFEHQEHPEESFVDGEEMTIQKTSMKQPEQIVNAPETIESDDELPLFEKGGLSHTFESESSASSDAEEHTTPHQDDVVQDELTLLSEAEMSEIEEMRMAIALSLQTPESIEVTRDVGSNSDSSTLRAQPISLSQESNASIVTPPTLSSTKDTVADFESKLIDFASGDSSEEINLIDETVDQSILDKIEDLSDIELDNYDTFLSTLTSTNTSSIRTQLLLEHTTLTESKRKETRNASSISTDMILEIKLFGLPYIVAPSEAEAQCAFLQTTGLVDGIVTDDSDVFLFGGTKVYRHMFNQNKHVLLIEPDSQTNTQRNEYIKLAFLLGSDYTEGVHGIGLVKAVAILTAWPGPKLQGLSAFKSWCLHHQSLLPPDPNDPPTRLKFMNLAKKLSFPSKFPDDAIYECYANPEVDEGATELEWGRVDLDGVRGFLEEKIGWNKGMVDEVLLPVIKQMNTRTGKGVVQRDIRRASGKRTGDTLESWGMNRRAGAAKKDKKRKV